MKKYELRLVFFMIFSQTNELITDSNIMSLKFLHDGRFRMYRCRCYRSRSNIPRWFNDNRNNNCTKKLYLLLFFLNYCYLLLCSWCTPPSPTQVHGASP